MPTRNDDPIADLLLRRLSPQHREILVATYFRRRTTAEAAQDLGLNPDTARSRLYHAMRDLSGMLAADRPDREAPVRPGAVVSSGAGSAAG